LAYFSYVVIANPQSLQNLTKKTMGGKFKRFILILWKNNYFDVGIIKRVFSKTIFLHINNCTLQIYLVYDECINYGYYLM